ncbi:MAG TPA: cytidylate kinase-like family protein [Gemmataceae bacterium]|nr:cytidylate kinase-like family protein [Gemmataceae bacterium]
MTKPTLPLERQVEALEGAQRHWQAQPRAGQRATAFTIALSREAGTPGTSVARALGARLGWPVYDHELLERIAQETGLRVNLLQSVDERQKGWLTEATEAFASLPKVSESGFVRHVIETVLSLGTHGRCVIVGRGSFYILPAATTLRVRLVGDLEDRITVAAARLGVSRKEAAQWVEQTERDRLRFIKDHFLKDAADPRHYDLVLSTSRWSVAESAELIVQALHLLEARTTGQAPAGV